MNCIKCGREIATGQMFCPECKLPSVELPAETVASGGAKKQKAAKQPQPKKKTSRQTLVKYIKRLAIALTVMTLLFAGLCTLVITRYAEFKTMENDLKDDRANIQIREDQAAQQDKVIAQLEAANAKLEETLAEAQKDLSEALDRIAYLESKTQ